MTRFSSHSQSVQVNAFSPVESEFLYKHTAFSIERLLNNPDDSQLEYLFERPADAVREELMLRFLRGEQYITTVMCCNFSAENGCLGHVPE